VTVMRNSKTGGKLFVDGRCIQTFDPTEVAGDLSNDQPLRIGNHACPDYRCFFHGLITEVSLYRRALTTAEIETLYRAGGGVLPTSEPKVTKRKSPEPLPAGDFHPHGLVGLWSGENNSKDLVGGNDAELTDITFEKGQVGQAFSFNGISSMIRVPADPAIDLGTYDGFTIMEWIKPTDVNGIHPLLRWTDYNPVSLIIGIRPWENGLFYGNMPAKVGGYYIASDTNTLTTNVFQQIAFTYDKSTGLAALYRNGQAIAHDKFPSELEGRTHGDLWFSERNDLAGNWSTGRMFSGLMDEIELYNRALSPEEIRSVYQAENKGGTVTVPR
jgi:Concanavalin A-like lectin/glucanases superfamily